MVVSHPLPCPCRRVAEPAPTPGQPWASTRALPRRNSPGLLSPPTLPNASEPQSVTRICLANLQRWLRIRCLWQEALTQDTACLGLVQQSQLPCVRSCHDLLPSPALRFRKQSFPVLYCYPALYNPLLEAALVEPRLLVSHSLPNTDHNRTVQGSRAPLSLGRIRRHVPYVPCLDERPGNPKLRILSSLGPRRAR